MHPWFPISREGAGNSTYFQLARSHKHRPREATFSVLRENTRGGLLLCDTPSRHKRCENSKGHRFEPLDGLWKEARARLCLSPGSLFPQR